jgi:methionyl aminopeptidase
MYQSSDRLKVGRNDHCPCGSGKKFKKCCMDKATYDYDSIKNLYYKQYKIRLKNSQDIEKLHRVGKLVVDTLDMVEEKLHAGMKTEEINILVHDYTIAHNAIPAPLNYRGFPKSVCVSINEVICHGIPGDRLLAEGDIVNVDVTSILDGYYADASKTYLIGDVGQDALKIVNVARECLKKGINKAHPGKTLGDIGWAIQQYAEQQQCSVVREFVGHGVGFDFHEAPQVPHYGQKGKGIKLVPGMVFTIEPMINLGKKDLRILPDKWTAVTQDNSLSAQFEQTVLVTENGCESLTPYEL